MTPHQAAQILGMQVRARKIECPHPHRKGLVWASASDRRWKCHDCQAFGDAADLARLRLGLSAADAARWVRQHGGALLGAVPPVPFPTLQHVAESRELAERIGRGPIDPLADWCEWRGLPLQAAIEAGVRGGRANDAKGHPAADGKPFSTGIIGTWWPAYHPAELSFPMLWRFRPLRPLGDLKCASMRGPLASACVLYRPGKGTLIICEGEPDWLVWCRMRPHAAIVGLTAGRWRPEWAAFGRECAVWAWVGHESQHEPRMRSQIEDSAVGVRLHVRTVPEARDWADRWAR